MAVMLIGMWQIDAIGMLPEAYPGYQIFAWGFIGLALRCVAVLTLPGNQAIGIGVDVAGTAMSSGRAPC